MEIKPFIKSWNENNIKKIPVTGSGFHTPGNFENLLFARYMIQMILFFLPDIVYAKHHINTPKSLK